MRTTTISKGGQISIPAEVRHRWGTGRVVLEDRGRALLIRPIPDDPIGAAIGSLAGRGPTSDELRAMLRQEEAAVDEGRRARR
jgi:AbrB family looped-hinge helix DNA binding protein